MLLKITLPIVLASTVALAAPPKAKVDPLGAEAETAMSQTLKDPSSAQFRNVRVLRGVPNLKGEPIDVVCGEVNGKNSYGGYIGFSPWIYIAKTKTPLLVGPDRNVAAVDLVRHFCK